MQNLIQAIPVFPTSQVAAIPSGIIAPQQASPSPLIVRAGEGHYTDQGVYRGYLKLDAHTTDGTFILLDVEADLGKGVPPHVHHLEDETFYIQQGRFQIQIGNHLYEVGPGDTLFAPRNIAHSWYCTGEEPGRLFILVTPGANFEAYMHEMTQGGQAPMNAMQDPEAIAAFMAMTEHYGMTMLPHGIEGTPERGILSKGPFIDLGDHRGHRGVNSNDSRGTLMWLNMDVDFQGGPPPHIHWREDETFIIHKGRFRVLLGEDIVEVGPGDIVFAPRGHAHDWQCISEEGGHALGIITPGENFETFASEMDRQQLMPPTSPGAIEKLLALGDYHGIQMLPPVW